MAKDIDKMINALAAKKVPVATLDNKWHKLFSKVEKTDAIKEYESKLNELLRKQGRINSEIKEIKRVKKELMDEIVTLMDDNEGSDKVEKNKKLISDCNDKIDSYNDDLMDLPKEIAEVNKQLMINTMDACYDELRENEKGIEELGAWLAKIRIELKKNVVRKQEYEISNQEIYSYMHDIFGAEVVDLFDMKYNPSDNPIKKDNQQ
jgi:chromosome segregation ATPase